MIKKIVKDTLALVVIALAFVLCLAVVYALTKQPIADAEYNEKIAAYQEVCSGAETFEDFEVKTTVSADGNVKINEVKLAKNANGDKVGYVLLITTNQGYGGDITLSMGMLADGSIAGVKVISMSETPGLGAKCTEESWTSQFKGINAEKVESTKDGKVKDNEIDAISGATYTTEAVVGAVNFGLEVMGEVSGK